MLYKPTSPSPYAKSVLSTGNLTLTCSMVGGTELLTRLKFDDGKKSYFLNNPDSGVSVEFDGYSSRIKYDLKYDDNYSGHTIVETATDEGIAVERSDFENDTAKPLNSIVQPNKDYSWQVRLYDNNSFKDDYVGGIWLAYGDVDEMPKSYSIVGSRNNYYYLKEANNRIYELCKEDDATHIVFKIRPHTNIYFSAAIGVDNDGNEVTKINSNNVTKFYKFYDDNARYYIKINGLFLRIIDYKYYLPYYVSASNGYMNDKTVTSSDFDAYGYPSYAYVTVKIPENVSKPIISVGDSYEIYCNYLDSDEYYFSTIEEPTVSLTDAFGQDLEDLKKDGVITIDYSNFELNGTYKCTSGSSINNYRVVVKDSDENVIDDTGVIYTTTFSYTYDRFIDNQTYDINITLCDTNSYVINKTFKLQTNFTGQSFPIIINVDYYRPHDSYIVDFSNFKSIPPTQADPAIGYEFVTESSFGIDVNNEEMPEYLEINRGNKLIYDYVVGVGELDFDNPVIYTRIRINTTKFGCICSTTDNFGRVCRLFWNGTHLIATWETDNVVVSKAIQIYEDDKLEPSYEDESEICKLYDKNTTIPYLWQEISEDGEIPWSESYSVDEIGDDGETISVEKPYYWHEETPMSVNWWTITVTGTNLYASCGENIYEGVDYNVGG